MSPGTAVTGFPPGSCSTARYTGPTASRRSAQSDLTTAYNDAAGRSPTANVPGFIGAGQTLAPGVYKAFSSLEVGGSLTLDAHGEPNAVFIFQAPSTLITDSASSVTLDRRRPGLQRVLASRQLRHARNEFRLHGQRPGPDVNRSGHR